MTKNTHVLANAGAGLMALSAFGSMGPAAAQTTAPEKPVIQSETVIVRGRSEAVFSMPASVETLSRADIKQRGIATLDEVAEAVPGLSMINDQDPGTNIVSLRGATTDRLQQASIALIVDGIALADTELFTLRQFDLARIDVLKGPQGALFGKNAAGGVIALTSAGPDASGGFARGGFGNGGWREAEGATSFGLSGDWQARLAGTWVKADGWITNRTLNRLVDATETKAARVSVAGPLPLGWRGTVRLNALQENGGAAWASSNNITGRFGGRLAGKGLTDPIGDYPGAATRSWYQGNVEAVQAGRLGTWTINLAADTYKKRWSEELDYRPGPLTFLGFPAFPNGIQPILQPIDVDSLTGQLRWASPNDQPVRWSAGAFAQGVNKVRVDDFGPLNFGFPPPLYRTRSLQLAVFGGMSADLTPELTLEAQGRFDRDARKQDIRTTGSGALVERRDGTFERFQPRLALSWRPVDIASFYIAYGEAFRTGGFNPIPLPSSVWKATYRPEMTRSLEAGVKIRSAADDKNRWSLTAAAYANDVANYQNYTFIDNNSVTLSVDAVTVRGAEINGSYDVAIAPKWVFAARGGAAFTDATIERFIAPDPIIAGARRNYSGKSVPNIPAWTGTATFSLSHRDDDWTSTCSLTLNGAGKTVFEIDNALYSPAHVWADARLAVNRGSWTGTLWAKNMTDERWAISAFGQGMTQLLAFLGPTGPFDTFTINRGRSFGVSVERSF